MPGPGKAVTPVGSTSSIWSLRLKDAAFRWRVQSGLKTICGTFRLSAQHAATRIYNATSDHLEPDLEVVERYHRDYLKPKSSGFGVRGV